jgi:hypothetical protein
LLKLGVTPASRGANAEQITVDDISTTATLDQADEDILTYTASDEALEAAVFNGPNRTVGCTLEWIMCGPPDRRKSETTAEAQAATPQENKPFWAY